MAIPISHTPLTPSEIAKFEAIVQSVFVSAVSRRGIRLADFAGLRQLESICIPASIEVLMTFSLGGQGQASGPDRPESKLTEVTFAPDSKLRIVESFAFYGCHSLRFISLPRSIEIISGESFVGLGLCQIAIEAGHERFTTEKGFIIDSKNSRAVRYCGFEDRVAIPVNIETIGDNCFSGLDLPTEICFAPSSQIRVIEPLAFRECSNLKSISIPVSVVCLGDEPFAYCNSLRAVVFSPGSKLRRIGQLAFDSCEELRSITIPSSLEILGTNCLHNCYHLKAVKFCPGSMLTRIEDGAFQDCSALTQFIVPESVEFLGSDCFDGCSSLSILRFSSRSRLRELLSLPPFLCGLNAIPDSVEVLKFRIRPRTSEGQAGKCVLTFGRDSRLHHIAPCGESPGGSKQVMIRACSFFQLSTRSLKLLRMIQEFDSTNAGD
jgi:hypothetical protein